MVLFGYIVLEIGPKAQTSFVPSTSIAMDDPAMVAERVLTKDESLSDEKGTYVKSDVETSSTTSSDVLQDAHDIVTHIISVSDDPSLSPWTFRAFFLGLGLSCFGGVLGE